MNGAGPANARSREFPFDKPGSTLGVQPNSSKLAAVHAIKGVPKGGGIDSVELLLGILKVERIGQVRRVWFGIIDGDPGLGRLRLFGHLLMTCHDLGPQFS